MSRRPRSRAAAVLLGALLLAGPGEAAAPGVRVALLPASQTVAPGAEFALSLELTRSGSPINAFDCVIGYDPAALELVQQTPIAQQEGMYFAAGCSNRFHRFQPGVGRDTISDVLLCAAKSLTGPGQIYRLRFKASTTAQVTTVRFLPGLQCYNAGLYVDPDSSSDAIIGIGVPVDSARVSVDAPALELTASADSATSSVTFGIEADRAGEQRLLVTDPEGHIVRRLQSGEFEAGARTVVWDGRDDSGAAVAPGSYRATIRVPGQARETRFTLAR